MAAAVRVVEAAAGDVVAAEAADAAALLRALAGGVDHQARAGAGVVGGAGVRIDGVTAAGDGRRLDHLALVRADVALRHAVVVPDQEFFGQTIWAGAAERGLVGGGLVGADRLPLAQGTAALLDARAVGVVGARRVVDDRRLLAAAERRLERVGVQIVVAVDQVVRRRLLEQAGEVRVERGVVGVVVGEHDVELVVEDPGHRVAVGRADPGVDAVTRGAEELVGLEAGRAGVLVGVAFAVLQRADDLHAVGERSDFSSRLARSEKSSWTSALGPTTTPQPAASERDKASSSERRSRIMGSVSWGTCELRAPVQHAPCRPDRPARRWFRLSETVAKNDSDRPSGQPATGRRRGGRRRRR